MTEQEHKHRRLSRFLRKREHAMKNQPDGAARHSFFLDEDDHPKKGFFLLPNLITAAGLFCGFWSITESLAAFAGGAAGAEHWVTAAWLIVAAALFDGIDGKVARWTHTSSAFGIEFDSLADLVSFGVAPGVLAFAWALSQSLNPKIGWAIATIFVISGALRLARFNVQFDPDEKTFMTGLAIPAGAGGIAWPVLFFSEMGWVTETGQAAVPNLMLGLVLVLSFLMISRIKYYSFKDIDPVKRRPFSVLLLVIVFIVVIARWPVISLFTMYVTYLVSGPVLHVLRRRYGSADEADDGSIID